MKSPTIVIGGTTKQQNKKLTSLSVSANLHKNRSVLIWKPLKEGQEEEEKQKKGCRKGVRESEEWQGRKFKK